MFRCYSHDFHFVFPFLLWVVPLKLISDLSEQELEVEVAEEEGEEDKDVAEIPKAKVEKPNRNSKSKSKIIEAFHGDLPR